jgi:hypothetical protein
MMEPVPVNAVEIPGQGRRCWHNTSARR